MAEQKATVSRAALAAALNRIKPATASRASALSLDHVQVAVAGGEMRVLATDTERFARLTLPAEGALEGVCLPHARLSELLEKTPGQTVALTVAGGRIVVRGERNVSSSLAFLPGDTLPHPPTPEGEPARAEVRFSDLALVPHVAYAAAREDEGKGAVWTGVYCEPVEGAIRFVAMNGQRLALAEVATDAPLPAAVVVPPASLRAAISVLSGAQVVAMEIVGGYIHLSTEAAEILVRTASDDAYPPYRVLLDHVATSSCAFNRAALLDEVQRAMVAAQQNPSRRVELRQAHDRVHVAGNSEAVSVTGEVTFEPLGYGGFQRADFNGTWLLDILRRLEGDQVRADFVLLSTGSYVTRWTDHPAPPSLRTHALTTLRTTQ